MEKRDLINILSKVKNHEMDVDEAVLKFKLEPFSDETIQTFQDFSSITVFDQNNVIGA